MDYGQHGPEWSSFRENLCLQLKCFMDFKKSQNPFMMLEINYYGEIS